MFLSFKCISDFPPFLGCHQHSFGCDNSPCLVLVTVFLLTFLHTSLKHLLCLLLLNRSLLSPAWNSDYCAFFKAIWGLVCSYSSLWFPTLPNQLCLLSSQLYIVVVGQSLCPVWPRNPMDCSMSGFPDHYWLLSLLKLMSIELVMHTIQPSHPLSPPSPFAFNLSQS